MFSSSTIRDTVRKLMSFMFKETPDTGDIIIYKKDGINAMKVKGFPTMIQVGSMSIMKLDCVVDDPRLRKLSETEDEYNERMKLLDEQ